MSDYVIVRINEQLIPEFQINYNINNSTATSRIISSWAEIKTQSNQELILIISAVLVLTKEVKIPSKNEEVIRQSIPYALEEYLSNDLDENHFSYNKSHENLFQVSVINKDIVHKILSALDKNELSCKKLYSEIYTLPASKDVLSIINVEDYFITNLNNEGTTLKKELIQPYIENSDAKSIHLYADKSLSLTTKKIENKHVNVALFQSKILTNNRAVNIFQGVFDQNVNKQNNIKPWKKASGIAAILFASWLFINLYQLWKVNKQIDVTQNQQRNLLLKLIPQASQSEINAPYSAIQSRLKDSQTNTSNNGSNGFIQSLLYVGQTLNQYQQIKISTIRQRQNKLEIKIQAPNVTALNQFQASLEKIALTRHVKTGTRESEKNGISSVITMEKL